MSRRPEPAARAARQGDALVFAGALVRDAVAPLWPTALAAAAGAGRYDLRAVPRVDSAGLALLAELAARAPGPVELAGSPDGLRELRAAYRLDPALRPAG
ncbi:MAG: STAS domain-containing protein [Gammaproteobacteria bacterium]